MSAPVCGGRRGRYRPGPGAVAGAMRAALGLLLGLLAALGPRRVGAGAAPQVGAEPGTLPPTPLCAPGPPPAPNAALPAGSTPGPTSSPSRGSPAPCACGSSKWGAVVSGGQQAGSASLPPPPRPLCSPPGLCRLVAGDRGGPLLPLAVATMCGQC